MVASAASLRLTHALSFLATSFLSRSRDGRRVPHANARAVSSA